MASRSVFGARAIQGGRAAPEGGAHADLAAARRSRRARGGADARPPHEVRDAARRTSTRDPREVRHRRRGRERRRRRRRRREEEGVAVARRRGTRRKSRRRTTSPPPSRGEVAVPRLRRRRGGRDLLGSTASMIAAESGTTFYTAVTTASPRGRKKPRSTGKTIQLFIVRKSTHGTPYWRIAGSCGSIFYRGREQELHVDASLPPKREIDWDVSVSGSGKSPAPRLQW